MFILDAKLPTLLTFYKKNLSGCLINLKDKRKINAFYTLSKTSKLTLIYYVLLFLIDKNENTSSIDQSKHICILHVNFRNKHLHVQVKVIIASFMLNQNE